MDINSLPSMLQSLRHRFERGDSYSYEFRVRQLKLLKDALLAHEEQIYQALYSDLHKSREECWVTEIGVVIAELNAALRGLRGWMAPERQPTNLLNLPSRSRIVSEPLGVVLVIGPWNYPLQLLLNPLVGAIAAGNCVVLKPSELAPATAAIMKIIIESTFDRDHILYVEGDGSEVVPAMMNNFSFDHVFFTGSTIVGKAVYKMAAERLVPVTLELGGKSPCVVERDANLRVAARRIVLSKFSNCGQMCIAPDYVLVHASVRDRFLKEVKECIRAFFKEDAVHNYNYGRMINAKQFDRVAGYLSQGAIDTGGGNDRKELFIEPTVLTNVPLDASVMNEEIFGPVLPVISFDQDEEARRIIDRHPNPLALYIYTSSARKERQWIERTRFGSGCVNNSSWQFTNHHLPFGGRGASGIGKYHGRYSFDTFSHKKSILKTPTWFDPAMRYPPFNGKLRLFKWVIK